MYCPEDTLETMMMLDDTIPIRRINTPEPPVAPPATQQPPGRPHGPGGRHRSRKTPSRVAAAPVLRRAARRAGRVATTVILDYLDVIVGTVIGLLLAVVVDAALFYWWLATL